MRTGLMATIAVTAVVVVAATMAPRADAQARRQQSPPDLLTLQGPGSSLGISARDITADEAQRAKTTEGAYVEDVRGDTPAARAGLKAGDIIVDFDGEKVRSARQLTRLVRETPPGRSVKATVVRDGSRRTLDVTPDARNLAALPNLPDINREVERALRNVPRNFSFDLDLDPPAGLGSRARLGVTLMSMSDQLSDYFGVKNGVLVSAVTEDSAAARGGLKAGDVITSVNGEKVDRAGDVTAALRGVAAVGGKLELKVTRERKETTVVIDVPARERGRTSSDRIRL